MCGIAGHVRFDGSPPDDRAVREMVYALRHRGPDGDGVETSGPVSLGHCRLAILDPNAGAQPLVDVERGLTLTYNGEVYNHCELRDELGSVPPFRTKCDTEVLLRAYRAWGIECLHRFRGMFAFALYDAPAGRLYLVRDRVGIKPLYYALDEDRLAFCSELTPLVQHAGIDRDIDRHALAGFLGFQSVPAPATIYRGVRKLEPGTFLEIDVRAGRARSETYWSVEPLPAGELVPVDEDEFDERLRETIGLYTRSDVPFGAFLSGGLDSSVVTAAMSERLERPVRTYAIGFREREHSELEYAAEAARVVSARHCEHVASPPNVAQLQRLALHFGEPFGDSSAVPTWLVSRIAAADVKMVPSGDGGDELFGGYESHRLAFESLGDPLGGLKRSLFRLLALVAPAVPVREAARARGACLLGQHRHHRRVFSGLQIADLLGVAADTPTAWPDLPRPRDRSNRPESLSLLQWLDFRSYLHDDVLTKVDRMSMAHSLEVRVPLLDHRLVETAFRLPLWQRLRRNRSTGRTETKVLLRRSALRHYSSAFLDRPKRGFGIPLADWCRGPWFDAIHDALADPASPLFDLVERPPVVRVWKAFMAGDLRAVTQVWCLFMLQAWIVAVHRAAAPRTIPLPRPGAIARAA